MKLSSSRTGAWSLLVVVVMLLAPNLASAALLYESATTIMTVSGGTGGSGVEVDAGFFSGVNFQLTQSAHITAIGGHFDNELVVGNNQVFGAIVPVAGLNSPPASPTLSSGVLATTLITLPAAGTSNNVSGAVSLDLAPGFYGIYFGSGKFGATSDFAGAIITTSNNVPVNHGLVPTYAIRQSDGSFFGQGLGARYFVEGTVPEPTSGSLAFGAALLTMLRRRPPR